MSRESIVRAAARLLDDGGAAAVTTRAVAHAAGVQAPTIYRLFGDKDGLINAVAEHVMASYVADTGAAVGAAADPVADLADAWRAHIAFGLAHPTLYVLLADPRRPSPAGVDGLVVLRSRIHRVAEAGMLAVPEDRAVELVHAVGTGTVLTMLSAPAAHHLRDTAWDAVAAAILTEHRAPSPDDPTAAVVAFRTVVPRLPGLSEAERTLMDEWLARSEDHVGRASGSHDG